MANNPSDGPSDDFFEQILAFPAYAGAGTDVHLATGSNAPSHLVGAPHHMMLQLSSGDGPGHLRGVGHSVGSGGGFHGGVFPLELSLEQGNGGFMEMDEGSGSGKRYLGDLLHRRVASSSLKSEFRGKTIQSTVHSAPYPPAIRPRVRARRGQATDPHSIAERLRRERIAEKVRALQDLVPNVNKTDRAAMVDEIVDYVKFLRLQVKVLSMSRLGGAGAVAQLVTDIPVSSVEDDGSECGRAPPAWEKWSNDGTDRQVAKLMEENVGAAMQFLQSKALCIMPVSLASTIYHSQPPKPTTFFNPESNNES